MKQLIKKIAVVLSVAFVCAPIGAMAADKLIVQDTNAKNRFVVSDTGNIISVKDTNGIDKMVVKDTGRIGIGTNAPTYAFHVRGNDVGTSSMQLSFDGNATYNKYNDAEVRFSRNNINDPTQNNGFAFNGDRLGYFSFGTMAGTTYKQSAGVFAEAAENQSATTNAGNLYLATTPPNYASAIPRLTVTSAGNIGVGTTTPQQKLEVNGGFRINPTWAKPACNLASSTTFRGTFWFTPSTSGADTLEVCAKDSAGNYAWKLIF